MVLTHARAATWDEDNDGDEPEMELWDALEEALNSRSRPSSKQVASKQAENEDGLPLVAAKEKEHMSPPQARMIVAAVAAKRSSCGWGPWAGGDIGAPDRQVHRAADGGDGVGGVEAGCVGYRL